MLIHFCLYSLCEKINLVLMLRDFKILTSPLPREKLVIRMYECYEPPEVVIPFKKIILLVNQNHMGPIKIN